MKQQQRTYPNHLIHTFPNVACHQCGHEEFTPIFKIKRVPYLYAQNDTTMEIMQAGFMCAKCMKSYPNPTELLSSSPSQEIPQEDQIASSAQ